MPDLVVTVPQECWSAWIAEGDAAGEPETGEEWAYFVGGLRRPPIEAGERLYIVAHDHLRGYAPVTQVAKVEGRWGIGRKGGAVAVTIGQTIDSFRGYRQRWWPREDEQPFPDWKTAFLRPKRAQGKPVVHAPHPESCSESERPLSRCGRRVSRVSTERVTCRQCLALIRRALVGAVADGREDG